MTGRLLILVFLPALALFLVVTSLPPTALLVLLIVACTIFVTPSVVAKSRWGEPAALIIIFTLIVSTGYYIYVTAGPFQHIDNPIVTFLAGWMDLDLIPLEACKIGIAIAMCLCLGLVAWVGNAMAEKAVVLWRP